MSLTEPLRSDLNDHSFGRVPMDPIYAHLSVPSASVAQGSASVSDWQHSIAVDLPMDLDQLVRQIGEW